MSEVSEMSEQNKQIARRFIEAFVAGDTTVLEQVVDESLVDHNPVPGQRPGRPGVIDVLTGWRNAFPDMEIAIRHEVAEGDLVAQSGIASGTNTGPLMGRPATNKPATFTYMDMHRVVNGRIVETWHLEDVAGMLGQLGLLPG
jgi:predicted ester cyclase